MIINKEPNLHIFMQMYKKNFEEELLISDKLLL